MRFHICGLLLLRLGSAVIGSVIFDNPDDEDLTVVTDWIFEIDDNMAQEDFDSFCAPFIEEDCSPITAGTSLRAVSFIGDYDSVNEIASIYRVHIVQISPDVVVEPIPDDMQDDSETFLQRQRYMRGLEKMGLRNPKNTDLTGAGSTIYILDTGVRVSHAEFGGRASGVFDY